MRADINLIPQVVYNLLGMGALKLTSMKLLMADSSMKKMIRVLCDVVLRVASLMFPVDFLILDLEVDFQELIIFGRPFIPTSRAMLDMELL